MNIFVLIHQKIGVVGICGWIVTTLAWTNPIQTKSFGYIFAVILLSYLYVYGLRKIFPDKLKKKDTKNTENEDWWRDEPEGMQPVLNENYLMSALLSGFFAYLIWTTVKDKLLVF